MIDSDLNIDIRRVAFRFYTWRLQFGTNIKIGTGTKLGAKSAAREFIKHRGEPL